jgi:predicted P-loop ATPase
MVVPVNLWEGRVQINKDGVVRQNHANLLAYLRNDPSWQEVVTYDEFAQVVWLEKPIPRTDGSLPNDWRRRPLEDTDIDEAVEWFQLSDFPHIGPEKVYRSIMQHATKSAAYHPVRDYLEELHWDDTERLDQWLIDCCGGQADTKNTAKYLREVGSKWMISAVARILDPGCQVDHVLIFEGTQGIGKTTALRILGGDHFSDGLPADVHTKDARDHVRGKWIIELAELSQMGRADIEAVKAFVSRREERFRPAYGKAEIFYPRQCVFAGTTNKAEYLRDETGNRRFWPVKVDNIDLAALERNRDQLWAESVTRFRKGELWHLTDAAVIATAKAEQSDRYLSDAWEGAITKYVAGQERVTVSEVMTNALDCPKSQQRRSEQNRVVAVLERLGWERKRTNKERYWVPKR